MPEEAIKLNALHDWSTADRDVLLQIQIQWTQKQHHLERTIAACKSILYCIKLYLIPDVRGVSETLAEYL